MANMKNAKKKIKVIAKKKKSNKNTYIRVKKDLKIHVTTNYFVTDRQIEKLIKKTK